MAQRRTTLETKQTGKEIESQEEMREEQTAGRGTALATPSSWWEARKTIERPRAEDQERHYREEQERYEQERQRAEYYRPIQLVLRSMQEMERPGAEERPAGRAPSPTTPSSWWEERKTIERPKMEEQERRYREEQERAEGGEQKDIFRVWADSYAAVSRMWEDSYTNLYKPWIESTEEMYSKAAELSRNPTPENYRAFYDEWLRTYQNTFGKLYPVMTRQFDKETAEKLMNSIEESRVLFQSWAAMLDENSRKTAELLQGAPDPGKYRELYDMWIRTYGKIFEDFVEMPAKGSAREVLEAYGGVPDTYLRNFTQMAKIWRDAYSSLYMPWVDSMMKLSQKMAELSRGEARPEAYKEFYNLWTDTYRETYGRLFNIQSARSASKEMAESFVRNTEVYMNMYKSWMGAMEKMSQKTMDISKSTVETEAYKESYNTWVRMYERAFDDFFKYVPAAGPLKSVMEPVKNTVKIYTDTFANMSDMWMRSVFGSAGRA
ncbi:MAG: hypothetical protein OIN66_05595 [Candidatus Methanoperedens sp.]|nr:hypothetical protein [Candidatus Methanoperedens sp.]